MKPRVSRIVRHLPVTVALWALLAAPARAQESLVITCENQNRCTYRRAYLPTVEAGESVRLVTPSAASSAGVPGKGRTVRLSTLPGLYREPGLGRLRVLSHTGEFGEVVLPSKLPRAFSGAAVEQAGWTVEYREQPKSKVRVPVPPDQFVALIRGPRLENAVVEFLKRETVAGKPHPLQSQLITGGLLFAGDSEELRGWRDELRSTMRRSLDLFRKEGVDPARMETTLAEGVSAIRIFRLVAPDARENVLQEDLAGEYRRLLERFAIARVLKNSKMYDAFLEKLSQIGLARWSRSDLLADAGQAVNASAEWHHRRATELFAGKQYGGAFDEARLASSRLPCDESMSGFYYGARVEFVNRNMIPARPEPENEHRSILQQIVRELQGIGQEPSLTPERVEYVRKRIVEGERLDKDYLPLQLKKAEFLANIGELSASREVVTRVERTVSLGRNEVEEWLQMDASLNGKLLTLRQRIERLVTEQISNGQFKEAVDTAAIGLGAEPDHPRFLYFSAVASAVLRDQEKARHFVERYLRRTAADCTNAGDVTNTMFDVYRRQLPDTGRHPAAGSTPNWVSGELYAAGHASYDAISGSFNPRIVSSVVIDNRPPKISTHFVWEGFLVNSIRTTVGPFVGERQAQLELEPVYEQKRVYMSGIGTRANSAGQRRTMPLRFLNSPDYDPALAAKFTGKMSTRGWAGNPFFHPFLWTDIFLFDLRYDELGRIKEAIPVAPDVSRPVSSFSEPLTFTWEGNTRRLLAISGATYRRELVYNNKGLLVGEKITHASGKGRITYTYTGKPAQLTEILCEDDFYDKAHRRVLVAPPHQ